MFNISTHANKNYLAKFIVIDNLIPHPKADRLKITKINGNSVIVGLDTNIGDEVIYFPVESQINSELLSFLNLFDNKNKNVDKTKGGFFGGQGRVRALELRKVPSQGFILPKQDLLTWLRVVVDGAIPSPFFVKNLEFDSFNDKVILQKYIPPVKHENQTPVELPEHFRLHTSTPHLGNCISEINPEDIISVSVKLHGTSIVVSKTLVDKKLNFWQKTLKFIGADVKTKEYKSLYSSRTVLKNLNIDGFGNDIYGINATKLDKFLIEGMSIYGEVVGYSSGGKIIQNKYDYGCSPNTSDVYIYRITTTTNDNHVVEWSAKQIIEWALINGLKVVPSLYYGVAKNLFPEIPLDDNWNINFLEALNKTYLEVKEDLCTRAEVPREGICLRVEGLTNKTYKYKSFAFLKQESKDLDAGIVDQESLES